MGQAQRNDRYDIARRPAQNGGRRISQGGGRSSAQGSRKRTGQSNVREVELWEINREGGQPRLMRLADPEGGSRSGKSTGRRSNGAQPKRTASRTTQQTRAARPRSVQAAKRRKAKQRKVLLYRVFAVFVILLCLVLIYQTTGAVYRMMHREKTVKNMGIRDVISEKVNEKKIMPPEIMKDFLEVNDYSRPGTDLNKIKSVFVHYTANPGTSAQQNRSYFANLAQTQERSASAHFIIGYEGELVQCIPLEEQAYAVATRNDDSISIECCYLNENGEFTQETYDTLVHTLAWLLQEYHLSTDDILRHYDCGGKLCPLYYVEHEDAWDTLLDDVKNYEPESTD